MSQKYIGKRVRVVRDDADGVSLGDEGTITDMYDERDTDGWATVIWVELDGGQVLDFRSVYRDDEWPDGPRPHPGFPPGFVALIEG